jgi:hypothetical protein
MAEFIMPVPVIGLHAPLRSHRKVFQLATVVKLTRIMGVDVDRNLVGQQSPEPG